MSAAHLSSQRSESLCLSARMQVKLTAFSGPKQLLDGMVQECRETESGMQWMQRDRERGGANTC